MGHLQDYATLPLPLTPIEKETLQDYEATITRGLTTFYEVGAALMAIKTQKLYRAEYRTFEEYCIQKWDIGHSSAYRMIDAAEIKENLSPIGDKLPENESQARALTGLEPNQQRQVWQKAVDTVPNGKITAQHIKDVRQVEIPIPEPEPQPAAAPVHTISVFVPDEQPRPKYGPCARCGTQLTGPGHFKPEGAICDRCDRIEWDQQHAKREPEIEEQIIEVYDQIDKDFQAIDEREPDAVIKDDLELEPEPAGTLAPGVWYICNFCGKTTQQAYNTFRGSNIKASICMDCTQKALHELQPATEAHVDELFQFYNTDRVKMVNAGLRVFRADDYVCVIKEFNGTGWKLFEKYESKAALKRAVATWANKLNMIFENHL